MRNIWIYLLLIFSSLPIGYFIGNSIGKSREKDKCSHKTLEEKINDVFEEEVKLRKSKVTLIEDSVFTYQNPLEYEDEEKIGVSIKNTASILVAKDLVLNVNFYTKTNKLLKKEKFEIYEYIDPQDTISYYLNITAPEKTIKILVDIDTFTTTNTHN